MIRSMTGFGRANYSNENREYIVEIKSVNNRYCDINIKIPTNKTNPSVGIILRNFNCTCINLKLLLTFY